jgi:hypothetical protein
MLAKFQANSQCGYSNNRKWMPGMKFPRWAMDARTSHEIAQVGNGCQDIAWNRPGGQWMPGHRMKLPLAQVRAPDFVKPRYLDCVKIWWKLFKIIEIFEVTKNSFLSDLDLSTCMINIISKLGSQSIGPFDQHRPYIEILVEIEFLWKPICGHN